MNPQINLRDEKIRLLEGALEKIVHPLKHLQDEAEKEGGTLNGIMAIKIIESSYFYQDIAEKALNKITSLTEQIKAEASQSKESIQDRIKSYISDAEPVVSKWIREDKESDERGKEVKMAKEILEKHKDWEVGISDEDFIAAMEEFASQCQPEITDTFIEQFIKEELPDSDKPFHYQAEGAVTLRDFGKWLRDKLSK